MHDRLNIRKKLRYALPFVIFLFAAVLITAPGKLCSRSLLPDTIISSWNRYRSAVDDSTRIVVLSRLAFYYNDFLEEKELADSLASEAIRIAEAVNRPGLLLLAYNNYLESSDNEIFYRKSISIAGKALQVCRVTRDLGMRWRTCRNLAQVYLSKYNFSDALSVGREALVIARALKDNSRVAESYLCIGGGYECMNRKIEAFRNYLTAADMAVQIDDPALLRKCYSKLSSFYSDIMLYDDAVGYKQKERSIILSTRPVDSLALMWTQYDLHLISVNQGKKALDMQTACDIIDFADRTRNKRLKNWEFGPCRRYLLESGQVMVLYRLYTITYPLEFRNLSEEDPEMYFRVMAYFKELEKLPDSADYYFKKARQLVIGDPRKGKIYQSNFFNRYGQFLERHGRTGEAIEKYTSAFLLAGSDDYNGKFIYMMAASRRLESLYAKTGDYRNAWFYASATLQISDSISAITKKDQLMAEAVRRERSQKEMVAEQDRQKIRQGRNQRNIMAGGVVVFIIISLQVYRNYRTQKRLNRLLDEAKNQSDQLLLNILPAETAEELKSTGRASAKRFDEVTVMFTDFKDFTQASERMSPEVLVDELNFYFSEFDIIISRHNIEKIKIIGDSYMCVGGLPVANATHAHDVVQAAVELREFMIARKMERSGRGETFFELRIGIHTGPVVAGIVGLKKFAYDIWGDTVNTASRMENSGEPNKINISGETYAKVKDRFRCTYRGKVNAKNKGEIDMYFVDCQD